MVDRTRAVKGANSCSTSAYVWVENHQKLVVCLRASVATEMPCMENGNRTISAHTSRNIHLFFTQFLRSRLSLRTYYLLIFFCSSPFSTQSSCWNYCSSHTRRIPSNFTSCRWSEWQSPKHHSVFAIYGDTWFTHSYSNIIEIFMEMSVNFLCRMKRRNEPHRIASVQLFRIVFQFRLNNDKSNNKWLYRSMAI